MTRPETHQPNHSVQKIRALIEISHMLEKTTDPSTKSRKSRPRKANSGKRTSGLNYDRGGSNLKKPYPGIAKQM